MVMVMVDLTWMMMLGNIRIYTRKEDKNNNRGNRIRMGDRVGNEKQSQMVL